MNISHLKNRGEWCSQDISALQKTLLSRLRSLVAVRDHYITRCYNFYVSSGICLYETSMLSLRVRQHEVFVREQ